VLSQLPEELTDDILDSIENRVIRVWNEIKYVQDTYIKITTFPFRDENYSFLGTIILVEDISKDCFFKDYLVRTERLASVAELAAGVAHEVNNPLGIIINYIEILKMKSLDGYSQQRLTKIDSELNRIKSIIESLLSFSHPNDVPFKPVDIDRVIDETLLLMKHQIGQKQVEVHRKTHGHGNVVAGNANQLKQVFINLITNSLEALDPGGTIEIVTKANRQTVKIHFIDDGKGVPPEIQEKVFNPFFSTKAAGKNTGLGLSICQYIIESHQGMLSLTKGASTDFTVLLPLYLESVES
jgi:two-component system sensor histidine kinase AtoS